MTQEYPVSTILVKNSASLVTKSYAADHPGIKLLIQMNQVALTLFPAVQHTVLLQIYMHCFC